MKKILFSLVALVCSMSMNAQVMTVMRNGVIVAKYEGADYKFVLEETTIGKAMRTGDIEVTWVQLWDNGPKFAEYNLGAANNKAEDFGGYYRWGTGNDDPVTNLWGSAWRMPTREELEALFDKCDSEWTTVNGVRGRKFTGKGKYASSSVFFPAAGGVLGILEPHTHSQGIEGLYWSSTPGDSRRAYYLRCTMAFYRIVRVIHRSRAFSVRAVLAE